MPATHPLQQGDELVNDFSLVLFAQDDGGGFIAGVQHFLTFVPQHWQFCLLHFLEFAIWGAWFVVLGNFLNARGFSRKQIGRIYATIPLGSVITPFFMGAIADRYVNTEVLIGGAHLIGAVLLFAMAKTTKPRAFLWITLAYALFFAPTLSLVNSIVFAHNEDIFGGAAVEGFPWIRVFGTIGWIVAGLSHAWIMKKDEPVNERPLLLACGLSVILGCFAFTLPETRPASQLEQEKVAANEEVAAADAVDATDEAVAATDETDESVGVIGWVKEILQTNRDIFALHPVFFGVSFVTAMAMGLYFAFTALYLEQSGVRANLVGPVMTIGQMIEIFFMLTLPVILGAENERMKLVLMIGICAWAVRFGLFSIGRPLVLILCGVAIHGICFDFFFAAGMMNTELMAPAGLTATAQQLYGWLVYGLGMYLGAEGAGWLNQFVTKQETTQSGETETVTRWGVFWFIPSVIIGICAVLFWLTF